MSRKQATRCVTQKQTEHRNNSSAFAYVLARKTLDVSLYVESLLYPFFQFVQRAVKPAPLIGRFRFEIITR
jgi:hypothetical protein